MSPMSARQAAARDEKIAWMLKAAAHDGPECMEWPWARSVQGYGTIRWEGRPSRAGHAVLALAGRPRPEGAHQLHSCDNPPCCSAGHLRWGTNLENIEEMRAKWRQPNGEKNGLAKLTEQDALWIRSQRGIRTGKDMARDLGVHQTVVQKVIRGLTWRYLLPEEERSVPYVQVPRRKAS